MLGYQLARSTNCQESLKVIEADVQHANMLAASIPRSKSGHRLQMKLVHNSLAPLILYLLQWIDCSCTCLLPSYLNLFYIVIYKVTADGRQDASLYGRRATIREFYYSSDLGPSGALSSHVIFSELSNVAKVVDRVSHIRFVKIPDESGPSPIILPYLQRLTELDDGANASNSLELAVRKIPDERRKFSDIDLEREDECGICLEPCTKIVLPNCCHSMCINCYRDWNLRSESCPFCRGSIKRVKSGDLWVLTCGSDVVDPKTVMKEDILRLYLYINSLPKDVPDALFLMHYEYLI